MDAISQAAEDIRTMRVRGAAKIGRHAAQALGRFASTWNGDFDTLQEAADTLLATRPSAVSLHNAVTFVVRRTTRAPDADRPASLTEAADLFDARARDALRTLGAHGAPLVPEGGTVLTHCNSQGALAPLFQAASQGQRFRVIATETRPWRQGLLTVRQLAEHGIQADLCVDSAMWTLLRDVDVVFVGSDTLAANGDVVNKIGTGGLAVLARERGVPFHVCAETFKVDTRSSEGEAVAIEERESAEVVAEGELAEGVGVRNPVFDVTPHRLVTSYVTELGVHGADELAPAARKAWELD